MRRRSIPLSTNLLRSYPAGAGLLVVITTVLGWLGCDSLSQVADRTADLLNRVPNATAANGSINPSAWPNAVPAQYPSQYPNSYPTQLPTQYPAQQPTQYPAQYPAQNTGFQTTYPYDSGLTPTSSNIDLNASAQQPDAFITIGSFNIQVFGVDKINDANLMAYLVDIARRFDVLAIQEVRSVDDSIIPRFVEMINQFGVPYGYVVGPRQGRTNSKEQYAFIYNRDKIEPISQGRLIQHPSQLLHRDPFCVNFRCRTQNPYAGFTFTLMNIHTDPDDVAVEVDALAEVYRQARQSFPYEDDFILLGDFNASPRQFGRLAQVSNLFATIPPDMATNTARNRCYDNIVFDKLATSEYLAKYGVFDLASFYRLDPKLVPLISDHQPIWAVFSAFERNTAGLAAQPAGFR